MSHNLPADLAERISHEEALINSRLTWMLTFQGFLFASLALASDDSTNEALRDTLLQVIPLLGAVVAALALLGVIAAYLAIGQARLHFESEIGGDDRRDFGGKSDFGGKTWARWLGRINSVGLPVVVLITWTFLYFVLT